MGIIKTSTYSGPDRRRRDRGMSNADLWSRVSGAPPRPERIEWSDTAIENLPRVVQHNIPGLDVIEHFPAKESQ